MRTTGLGLAAVMTAAGAILAWAVTAQVEGVDLNQVGMILFIIGIGLAVISLAGAALGRRTTIETDQESVVDGRPVVRRQRETITEHDGAVRT